MANEEIKVQNVDCALRTANKLFLTYGIDRVTKEMISRESGLSRKSIDRYFIGKLDCVLQAAKWTLSDIRAQFDDRYPESLFTGGKYTGAQILERYMNDLKKLFMSDPRIFALYMEFKLYIYRNCDDEEQAYSLIVNQVGSRRLRRKIYELGKADGTLQHTADLLTEEEYFCESFFGFLSNLALSFSQHSPEEIERQIDNRIINTLSIYRGDTVGTRYVEKAV